MQLIYYSFLNPNLLFMKSIFFGIAILLFASAYSAPPNEKILKSFSTSFPKAEKISWFESGNDAQVEFFSGAIKCKVWYDADGNVLKTNRYYTAESLSPFILSKLQQKYNGKKVFGITEVSSEEGITFYIVLEDE